MDVFKGDFEKAEAQTGRARRSGQSFCAIRRA